MGGRAPLAPPLATAMQPRQRNKSSNFQHQTEAGGQIFPELQQNIFRVNVW